MFSIIRAIYRKAMENWRTLAFWPCFGLTFFLVEQINRNPWRCHEVGCKLDGYIPFCEYFVIAYIMWFVYMAGTIVYLIFLDSKAYETTMKFIIITFSVTIGIYLLFPTVQLMRPYIPEHANVFAEAVRWFYRHDTPTNVCPSLHVVGTLATMYGAMTSERLMSHRGMKTLYAVVGFFICISTVFLKQHSVIDLAAGATLCLVVWLTVFRKQDAAEETEEQRKKAGNAA